MKRYLSTLAYSGLLGIAALYGGAFAAPIPSSIPDIIPTVNAVGVAFRTHPAQPVDSGSLSCSTAMRCDQGGLQPAVLIHKQNDHPGGVQLVRGGGGGGGGGHGGGTGGGHSSGGMGGSGVSGSGGGRGVDAGGGDTFFGFGQYRYPYRNPYYGPWYPGY
ncbi:hypothetical protein [Pseudaminobacter soli (ex Li et al. 2025)]|uniref:hypothetical protein n=1 Tax=Pseudaminobacter soli (ex Li et al. 2025) TaxID=1295366 RepID=UPI0015E72321|nr:hypothetical protein [Mesorhizobium soli]